MNEEISTLPMDGDIVSFPRPVPDWLGQILEYLYLLGATLWLGVQAASTLLIAPLIARNTAPTLESTRLVLWLLENLGYVATIASAILLLTIAGMHLLKLRSSRTILLQLFLVLVMTLTALSPMLMLVPKLSSLIRVAAITQTSLADSTHEVIAQLTLALGSMGLLHLVSGSVLIALAVRRRYSYPRGTVVPLHIAD